MMRFAHSDPQLRDLVHRYVVPGRRYELLSYRVLTLHEQDAAEVGRRLAQDAAAISDDDLRVLFEGGWRERITAAWLVGMAHRTTFRPLIAELLLASEVVYAGQGYCFALARFGTHEDAAILISYLDHHLPELDHRYDQPDALGALLHLDARHGTHHADRYLAPGGLWQRWVAHLPWLQLDPAYEHCVIDQLCAFAEQHNPTSSP
ncbi:DUF6000 family protein [Micromonospora sp. NPDC003197]